MGAISGTGNADAATTAAAPARTSRRVVFGMIALLDTFSHLADAELHDPSPPLEGPVDAGDIFSSS
jgi:hypothetical protein